MFDIKRNVAIADYSIPNQLTFKSYAGPSVLWMARMPSAIENGGGGGGEGRGGGGRSSVSLTEPQVVASDTHRSVRVQSNLVGQQPDLKPPSYQSQYMQPEAAIGVENPLNVGVSAPPPYSQSSPPAPLLQESIELGPPLVPAVNTTSRSELDIALERVNSSIAPISCAEPTNSAPGAPKY